MPGLIDTNLLVYAVNDDSREHRTAAAFLRDSLAGPDTWYLTEGIVYEFLRVATHRRVFPRPLAWRDAIRFVDALVTRDNVRVLTAGRDHWTTLEQCLVGIRHPAGNLFYDIRSYALMREHGVRTIYTADTDFLQFDDIVVIDPLRA